MIKPEAVYFLVVSLHEMISGQVAAVDEQELVRIRDVLPEDVVTILSEALRHVTADITGHDVADAISANWPVSRRLPRSIGRSRRRVE
ncbi:MAG TPA: hypothetical protein VNX67_01065 [Solirubrobacteraceae bacterium]|jgi:hypothetical protein|nr:hypothetical protein [Solirubrobacteraceae bacterium]